MVDLDTIFDTMDDRFVVFGSIFTTSNRLQLLLDKTIPDLSAKQWFVMTMLTLCEQPPSLIQLARVCDSSYQNIKQIVLKLEDKGFVRLEADEKDKRTKRVVITSKHKKWEKDTREQSARFVDTLFEMLSLEQVKNLKNLLLAIYERLGEMQNEEKI